MPPNTEPTPLGAPWQQRVDEQIKITTQKALKDSIPTNFRPPNYDKDIEEERLNIYQDALRNTLSSLNDSINNLTNQVNSLTNQINSINNSISSLDARVTALEALI
jgi:chromosome segregation ATPase